MSYCHKDWNVAFYAMKVLLGRTGVPVEKVWLYGSQHAPRPPRDLACVNYLKCDDDPAHYPLGSNTMMAGLMAYATRQGWVEPVFMCEPDGFPTCADWYDRILKAHNALGTHVSGSCVDWVNPKHYNGNLVIHPELVQVYPCLGRVVYQSWDVFHAELLIKHGGDNKEILNPRRERSHDCSAWWWKQTQRDGYRPAWLHGCQGFMMWEKVLREGFDGDSAD